MGVAPLAALNPRMEGRSPTSSGRVDTDAPPCTIGCGHTALSQPNGAEDNNAKCETTPESSSGSVTSQHVTLALPVLRQTAQRAVSFTLVEAMLSWNVPVPSTCCCPFHASCKQLQASLRSLRRS